MNCHDHLYACSPPKVNSRRWFLKECGLGLGKVALASLLTDALAAKTLAATSSDALKPRSPHFPGKAKHVIHLFLAGAPSQLDLFDHKPELAKLAGKPLPPSVIAGQRYAFIRPDAAVLGPQYKFNRHGQSGVELSSPISVRQPTALEEKRYCPLACNFVYRQLEPERPDRTHLRPTPSENQSSQPRIFSTTWPCTSVRRN